MNMSRIFIERPIGTTLLAIGLFLVGLVAYLHLPVSSLPSIEFPTIRVQASRPGADPTTMAATVAAPLERRLGQIAGVTEMTSSSSLGSASIAIQFDLTRDIDGAARDVQAALNSASADLPGDLPQVPTFRKMNPSAAPVLILALTSDRLSPGQLYDAADSVIAQRISQVTGVAEVQVSGAAQPAIRVRVNPTLIASIGISMEEVRQAIADANSVTPVGAVDGDRQSITIATNSQLKAPDDYKPIVVKTRNGSVVRLTDIATIEQGTRDVRSMAMFNAENAILLIITKQGEANVIDTVDGVKALLPDLRKWVPAGVEISILSDRTGTIRASVHDMQLTLAISVALVMAVVFVFLGQLTPTLAAGVTVPLSLAGTAGVMWLFGFSINNLTLMALAIAVGFVVDDAIVMIENVHRNLERGMRPMAAALTGARQIGFTVISISVSLIAAFIPVLFMPGIVGRMLNEFSITLAVAIAVSAVVSLSVTPMMCAHMLKQGDVHRATLVKRFTDAVLNPLTAGYAVTLRIALRNPLVMLFVLVATIGLTWHLYQATPKSFIPEDDTGLIMARTEGATDVSFDTMVKLQRSVLERVLADPAVSGVGSSVGGSGMGASSVNQGRMFISLKPLAERQGKTTGQVGFRLRDATRGIPGIDVRFMNSRDIRVGARSGKGDYQYTLWSMEIDDLYQWVPKVVERIKKIPGLIDVTTDREQGGLELDIKVDRDAAARLGVPVAEIDNALANAFSQRQISTIYATRNQYRVILDVDRAFQRQPSDIPRIYVPGKDGVQVPLASVIKIKHGLAPLVVNHQGPFPAVTITYNLAPGTAVGTSLEEIERALADLHMPDSIRAEPAGDAKAFQAQAQAQMLLIFAALVAVYIVLGVLYESFAHPLTIISTLPSAGLGALLALQIAGMDLSLIALIGVILLIGIVKKNGIMMVDFALDAERDRGLPPARAIYDACLARFRPILMTTLAALFGAIPLAIATGPGSELRRPLGITIIGGLIVSQILTLYTTPVIYLMLDRLGRRLRRTPSASEAPDGAPAPVAGE